MAENAIYTVSGNKQIARDVFCLRLDGPTGSFHAPGQFVNVRLPDFYLRRPFSVSQWDDGWLEIVYKVVGGGTRQMTGLQPGDRLDLLAGLGNGFDLQPGTWHRTVLVGGGVGTPPLYALAKALADGVNTPLVALGFATAEDVFFQKEFEALGCEVHIATEDGTLGAEGLVTGLLEQLSYDYYYACGPNPMLRAVHAVATGRGAEGQLSFEERMGCGFGTCMGCSCQTLLGPKRVCVDGPVFSSREVMFP